MQQDNSLNNDFDIGQYLKVLNRNKFLIFIVAISCLMAGLYVAKSTPKVYNATARIIADPYQPNADREEQYIASAMVFLFFETQYEIITSRALSEKVVDNLNLVEKFKQEQAENKPKDSYLKTELNKLKTNVKSLIGFEEAEAKELSDAEIRIMLAEKISSSIVVTGGRKNQIITINYESKDPQLAADIINTLSDAYIEFGLTTRLTDVQNQQKWLSTQYQQLKHNLENSEQKLKDYREKEGLIHSYQERAIANTQLQALNQNLINAQTTLSAVSVKYALAQEVTQGKKHISALAKVVEDQSLVLLIQDETQKNNKVEELSERYGDRHPKMIEAKAELRNATKNLKDEASKLYSRIQNEFNLAKSQVDNVKQLINDIKNEEQSLQDASAALVSLEREVENNRRIYEAFQSRLLEANIKGEISASNVHIIDRATVPNIPISPNVKKIIIMFLGLGIFLGIALAFGLDALNNTFRTPDTIESKIKLPVLGITPFVKKKRGSTAPEKLYFEDSRTPFAESINTIRTGLIFSNIDNPPKTVLITSATGAEGKSTLALNLASSLSYLGKTLLLEVDLRKPSVLKNMQFENRLGLTNILSGEIKSLSDAIHTVENSQLDIITCGSIPKNPMELLSSSKFEKLLASLSERYEHIILDGPPTLPVSDSCILANKVDGVILSIRANDTKVKVAKEASLRLRKHNANILGAVLTVAELKKLSYYGDHYYAGEYYGIEPEKTNA